MRKEDKTKMKVDKKGAEVSFRKSEEKYRFLFEHSQINNIFIGTDRKIINVNKTALNSLGYKLKEVIGKDALEFVVPHQRREASAYLNQALKNEYLPSIPVSIKTKKGEKRIFLFAEGYARLYKRGDFAGILISAIDITERIEAEKTLKKLYEMMITVLDSFDTAGVYVTDMKTYEILFANRYINDLFGQVAGKRCWEVFMPAGQEGPCNFCPNDKIVNSNGEPTGVYVWEFENPIAGRYYELHDMAIKWLDKRVVKLEIAYDITNRRKMEEEFLKKKKLEAMNILTGGLVHDFSNLLTGITGNISLAREGLTLADERVIDKLAEAEKASLKAKELIRKIILLSNGGVAFLASVDIKKILVEECSKFYLKNSKIMCARKVPDYIWNVKVDAEQLGLVISHLLENASDAMPNLDEGIITVSAENINIKNGEYLLKNGRYVIITVKDQGIGILKENLPNIFDPYFTTKGMGNKKGVGLGLAMCESIVRKHGGIILVDSKVGSGTTFKVFLPAFEEG